MAATGTEIAANLWGDIERELVAAGVAVEPIRTRVRSLAESYADLMLRSAAGEDVQEKLAVIRASEANLEAGTSMVVARTVRNTVRSVLLRAIRFAFGLLAL